MFALAQHGPPHIDTGTANLRNQPRKHIRPVAKTEPDAYITPSILRSRVPDRPQGQSARSATTAFSWLFRHESPQRSGSCLRLKPLEPPGVGGMVEIGIRTATQRSPNNLWKQPIEEPRPGGAEPVVGCTIAARAQAQHGLITETWTPGRIQKDAA